MLSEAAQTRPKLFTTTPRQTLSVQRAPDEFTEKTRRHLRSSEKEKHDIQNDLHPRRWKPSNRIKRKQQISTHGNVRENKEAGRLHDGEE